MVRRLRVTGTRWTRCTTVLVIGTALLMTLALSSTGGAFADTPSPPGYEQPPCADADLVATPSNAERVADAVVCEINRARAGAAEYPVRRQHNLDDSSTFQSRDMVESHFLAHQAPRHPSLLNRLRDAGYFGGVTDALFTENIGVAPAEDATARVLVDGWMQSEDHQINILTPLYKEIGVGIAFAGPDPTFYSDRPSVVFTTDFGRRWFKRACTARRTRTTTRGGHFCPRTRRHHA